MPVTMRYSASLDRTYEEGGEDTRTQQQSSPVSPPPSHSVSDSSPPTCLSDNWNDNQRDKQATTISVGQHMDEGLSDSMDSLALDDDSNSSTSGHSRQHSSDGGGSSSPAYATKPLSTLSPRPPPFNPLQFVKTAASPLVKKAEAQIKQYEEVKKVKELVKEEAEEWQSNLDVWKNRRKLVSQKSVQRVEESKQIEEEIEKKGRKSKTFNEMMEERTKRGTSKSLPSVFNDEESPIQVPLAVEEDLDDLAPVHEKPNFNGNGNGVSHNGHKSSPNNGHNRTEERQQLSGFEEAIRSYAEYAEETNNKSKTKNNSPVDYSSTEYNGDSINNEVNENHEIESSTKEIKVEKEDDFHREAGKVVTLSVHLRRQSEHKDFGFSLKSVKGVGTGTFVETIQSQSPAETAGVHINDELLSINGERCTADRSHSAIVFAIKQAVYTGQLQLTVYRYDNPETVIQPPKTSLVVEDNNCSSAEIVSKVDVMKRRSLFERTNGPERLILNRRSLDLSVTLKDKLASFEGNLAKHKSSEMLNTAEENHVLRDLSIVKKEIVLDDTETQVESGLFGFELASTLQETPIINSVPSSPTVEPKFDSLMEFDFAREDVVEVINNDPVNHEFRLPEPPKEKPPPPPPPPPQCDPAADPAVNKTVKLRRVESTKRILKEINKRRSDFLGIENDQFQKELEEQMSQVSPPPNADEMLLRMEKERLVLNITGSDLSDCSFEQEIEDGLLSPSPTAEDIDQKEREIIESLEQWEEEQKLKVSECEVAEAEKLNMNVPEPSTAVKVVLNESCEVDGSTKKEKTLEEKELELKEQEERLRNEKEKLRREQEELMKQKKEYEKKIQKMQKQQSHIQTAAGQVGFQVDQPSVEPKLGTPPVVTVEPPNKPALSKAPPPPILAKPKQNDGSIFSSTDDDTSSHPKTQIQVLTKPNLVALSAPPKAKLMDGEEWMQRRKRENYHQHWLVQEAEFRRLQAAQVKESEKSLVEDRLLYQPPHSPSKHHIIDMDSPPIQRSSPRQTNGTNGLGEVKTQEHFQKPVPRPPAKPVFQQNSSSSTGDRRTNPPLTRNVDPSPPLSLLNQNPPSSPNSSDTQILSVSGKKRCSHCGTELGRGAAMIIESLQLFYHIGCFKCCVCHVQLGNGSSGTDVRVRSQKLHCHNCYSNDEGLKFSKV